MALSMSEWSWCRNEITVRTLKSFVTLNHCWFTSWCILFHQPLRVNWLMQLVLQPSKHVQRLRREWLLRRVPQGTDWQVVGGGFWNGHSAIDPKRLVSFFKYFLMLHVVKSCEFWLFGMLVMSTVCLYSAVHSACSVFLLAVSIFLENLAFADCDKPDLISRHFHTI